MNKNILLSLIIGLIIISCTDQDTVGLEIQPVSENIVISDHSSFSWQTSKTESEDSLRTDEALNLVLGEIHDADDFGYSSASFITQLLLIENSINLGINPTIDSVILSYTYSGYYGDLDEFTNLEVDRVYEDVYKDSVYYSNSFNIVPGNTDWVDNFSLSESTQNPFIRIKLKNTFAEPILINSANLQDNETFLQYFKGISVLASTSNTKKGTMLYLNPDGANSFFKIYYHNEESSGLVLEFQLGGDAARINTFNPKSLSQLVNEQIDYRYIQSMAGYKLKVSINNIDSIKNILHDKALNKVIMSFNVPAGTQDKYNAHDKLFLVRVNQDGENVFLIDYIEEGEAHFGGILDEDKYEFNITRYFHHLIHDDKYTKDLYLLPAGAAVNANRTILDANIKLIIYYSEL